LGNVSNHKIKLTIATLATALLVETSVSIKLRTQNWFAQMMVIGLVKGLASRVSMVNEWMASYSQLNVFSVVFT